MRLVVTKILSSRYKGDFAIATAMLSSLRTTRPDWSLSLMARDMLLDAPVLEKYGSVVPELFSEREKRLTYGTVLVRLPRYLLWYALGIRCLDAQGRQFVDQLSGADALVFCGGGSPGGYGLPNLVLHAVAPLLLASRVDTPVIFTGLGLELTRGRFFRILARWVLNRSNLIAVRDPLSAETISRLRIRREVRVTADWAFLLTPLPPEPVAELLKGVISAKRLHIGMNLRDQNSPGPDGSVQAHPDRHRKLLGLIHRLLERTSAEIVVVSMNRSRATDDLKYALELRASLPDEMKCRFHVLAEDYPAATVSGIVGAMDIFIATRLHPAIFSLSAAVPTLALHHLEKLRSLMDYYELSAWFLPIDETGGERIADAALSLLDHREDLSHFLVGKQQSFHAAALNNIAAIEAGISEHLLARSLRD